MSIKLRPNCQKILEAILLLLSRAESSGARLTQYDIVKSIFIADMWHLEKYGRPISFDNYAAMENGPVPSETYNILKLDYRGADIFGDPWPLWKTGPAVNKGKKAVEYFEPCREPNLRKLSKTDIQELSEALKLVQSLGFSGTKDFTHMNPAYAEAWKARGSKKSVSMEYTKLLSDLDHDAISQLAHASKHM